MSSASTPFNKPQAAAPLPQNDKREVGRDALKAHLPATRPFATYNALGQSAFLEIIDHHYNGVTTLRFVEALNAVADAIGYVNHNRNNPDALRTIDIRLLGQHIPAEAPSLSYTIISSVARDPKILDLGAPKP